MSYVLKGLGLIISALLSFSAEAKNIPYFYSIQKNGMTSYILGSFHLGVALNDLAPEVSRVVKTIPRLAFEIEDTEEGLKTSFSKDYIYGIGLTSELRLISGGRVIGSLHDKDKKRLIEEFGVPQGLVQYFHYDDSYCTQILFAKQIFTEKRKHLDLEIMLMAYQMKRPIFALENDLIRLNANNLKPPTVLCNVRTLLDMIPEAIESEQNLIEQYKMGELPIGQLIGQEKAHEYRHKKWLPKMLEIMKKPTLFVVGAYHLMGSVNVLDMLKAQGYEISPVSAGDTQSAGARDER